MADDAAPDRDHLPGWVPRAVLIACIGIAALQFAEWIFFQLRGLFTILLVSLFLSFAIEPAVNWLAARGWRRGPATGLMFFGLFVATIVFVGAIGTLVIDQVSGFVDEAPAYIEDIEEFVNERFDAQVDADEVIDQITSAEGPIRDLATQLASNALGFSTRLVGALFQFFTVLLFTFYLVADGPRLRRAICSMLPPDRQRNVLDIWELAISKTGGYIYSRLLLSGLSAASTWIALTIIGVPYAAALGVFVGVISQFVPVIGTYLGGVLPVLVALLNEPLDAIWTLLFVLAYQQVENYVFAPRITARTMDLHPAVAFGTVIAGAGLMGPMGAILALPAAAILQAFGSTYVERHEVVESRLVDPGGRLGGRIGPLPSRVDPEPEEKSPPPEPS